MAVASWRGPKRVRSGLGNVPGRLETSATQIIGGRLTGQDHVLRNAGDAGEVVGAEPHRGQVEDFLLPELLEGFAVSSGSGMNVPSGAKALPSKPPRSVRTATAAKN